MSKQLILCLNNIEKHLKTLHHSCLDYLNKGLSSEEIQAQLSRFSLQSNDELVTLFSWRDGVDINEGVKIGHLTFFPGFYFMSLNECINNYIELENLPNWEKNWFPIFANGGGDFYAIDLNKEMNGGIIGFFVYEDEHTVEYNSLSSMMETFNECYEKGIIYRDNNGYLDMDYSEHAIIAHRLNPNLQIWIDEVS